MERFEKGLMLFSGGIDSTYTVMKIAPFFDSLTLNTYKTPGMINVGYSKRSAGQLRARFGDKIEHNVIDISDFIEKTRGGIRQCIRDNRKYKFFYSWCLGCKLSMHLYTIDYCKRHDIGVVADGSNQYDAHALEQKEEVKGVFGSLYKLEGIDFITPCYTEEEIAIDGRLRTRVLRHLSLYKDATAARVRYLRENGIDVGRGVMSQYRRTQPSCVASLFFNGYRALMKTFRKEVPGCCGIAHGYLNYVKDKAFGEGAGLSC